MEAERLARATGSGVALARVLRGRGEARRQRGRMDEAEACFLEALPLVRGEDRQEEAECWRGLGDVFRQTQRVDLAREAYEAGLAIGDMQSTPPCHRGLATLAQMDGNLAAARTLLTHAETGFRAFGSRLGRANCLNDLGDLERESGNTAAAERAYRKALAIYRSLGTYGDIWPRVNLALLWLEEGRSPRAWLEEVLIDIQRVGLPGLEGGVLLALSLAALRHGDVTASAEHLSAAGALLDGTGDADPDNLWPLQHLVTLARERGHVELAGSAQEQLVRQQRLLP